MKPSAALTAKRDQVKELLVRHRSSNLRVFGSASRGEDTEFSDLDLLVDPMPGATLFDLGGLHADLEQLLGVAVDLVTPGDLRPDLRRQVLAEAMPV